MVHKNLISEQIKKSRPNNLKLEGHPQPTAAVKYCSNNHPADNQLD